MCGSIVVLAGICISAGERSSSTFISFADSLCARAKICCPVHCTPQALSSIHFTQKHAIDGVKTHMDNFNIHSFTHPSPSHIPVFEVFSFPFLSSPSTRRVVQCNSVHDAGMTPLAAVASNGRTLRRALRACKTRCLAHTTMNTKHGSHRCPYAWQHRCTGSNYRCRCSLLYQGHWGRRLHGAPYRTPYAMSLSSSRQRITSRTVDLGCFCRLLLLYQSHKILLGLSIRR